MLPVASYTFTIPAGGSFPLLCEGRYFRINAASGTLKIDGQGSFGPMGAVGVGQGLRLRPVDQPFRRLSFVDTSGAPNIVTVIIADADFVDNTVLGNVSVVDGNKQRTLAGGAFGWRPTSVAANRAHAQLWNPTGSGKNIIVDALLLTSTLAGAITVGSYNTQLATAGQATYNLRSDSAAASVAVPKVVDNAIALFDRIFGTALVQANGSWDFTNLLKRPIVIGPNTGLILISEIVGATLSGFVSFFEEAQ